MTRSIVADVLLLFGILVSALGDVHGDDSSMIRTSPVSPSPPPQLTTPLPSPPPPPRPTTPLCDQEQLVLMATTVAKLELKKQCEEAIHEPEMMQTGVPEAVCSVPTCVAALQTMYRSLPRCRFRDWDVQFHAEMLLRNCGIEPANATQAPDASGCNSSSSSAAESTRGASFVGDTSNSGGDGGSKYSSWSSREAAAGEQQPSFMLLRDDGNKK